MTSDEFQHLNDEDFGALVAYLKGDLPLLTSELIDHQAAPPPAIPSGPTLEFGKYIVRVGGCYGCHGQTLSGGRIPGAPPEFKAPANITPAGIGHYTEADFFAALREGKRPAGTMLDTNYMPVHWTRLMTDDEIRAAYAFLKTVPPKEYGGR